MSLIMQLLYLEIAETLGSKLVNSSVDPCQSGMLPLAIQLTREEQVNNITCNGRNGSSPCTSQTCESRFLSSFSFSLYVIAMNRIKIFMGASSLVQRNFWFRLFWDLFLRFKFPSLNCRKLKFFSLQGRLPLELSVISKQFHVGLVLIIVSTTIKFRNIEAKQLSGTVPRSLEIWSPWLTCMASELLTWKYSRCATIIETI